MGHTHTLKKTFELIFGEHLFFIPRSVKINYDFVFYRN